MRTPRPAALSALLLGVTVLSACHFHDRLKVGRGHQLLVDTTGMEREHRRDGAILFRRPDMRPLSEFTTFILEPVRLESYSAADRELSQADRRRLREFFYNAVASELTLHDYPLVILPGDDVLAINLSISGLVPSHETEFSRLVDIDPRIGGITIQAVFRDASSARTEAIYMRTVSGATLDEPGLPQDPWADAEKAMRLWAIAFREALDEAHGKLN